MIKKNLQMKKVVVVVCMALAMLCGGKSAVAQNDYTVDEWDEYFTLVEKVARYVDYDPQDRAQILMDTGRWSEVPDFVILLKDLQSLFNKTIEDESRLHDMPPDSIPQNAGVHQFYEDIRESDIFKDPTNMVLPDEVVEAMDVALSDSSNCTECPSSTATTGGSDNTPKMICSGSLSSVILILNAYFSCTPEQRLIFYQTYCVYPCGDLPSSPCDYNGSVGGGGDCDRVYNFLSRYGSNSTSEHSTVPIDVIIWLDLITIGVLQF